MRIKSFILGISLVFLSTGCTLQLPLPFTGKTSSENNSSNSSNNSSESNGGYSSTQSSSGSSSSSGGSSSSSTPTPTPDPDNPEDVNQYYASISDSLTGATLKTALFNKIKITNAGWSYDGLWTAYKTTDVRPDGKHFWDIYSDTTMYTLDDKRINASYDEEGDSINREHVIPQSSFKEAAPMKSDIHHVLPSDGYVNNRRSNYPHGNVTGTVKYTSNDGCKLGTGTGNTTVFEPMSHYKGDIARIYFYFVTCYENKMSSNTFSGFNQTSYPSIKPVYLDLYLQWHLEDPVSQKELDRNNAAYVGQKNRNPFIDRPSYACKIWGDYDDTTRTLCGLK